MLNASNKSKQSFTLSGTIVLVGGTKPSVSIGYNNFTVVMNLTQNHTERHWLGLSLMFASRTQNVGPNVDVEDAPERKETRL